MSSNLTPESKGVFTFLPKSISDQLLLDRDPHGNVQVAKIDTERLLILLLASELEARTITGLYKGTFTPQAHYFGYEGRCALPSNLDSNYCYSLGLNAAVLMHAKAAGYMSCIKGLADPDPKNWTAAGCPLPIMMHLERRKGKDVPVIKKALVELDQPMFKSYEMVREKWAILDCYQSPGPIQFKGICSTEVNYLVKPPNVEQIIKETEILEKFELEERHKGVNSRTLSSLSNLSKQRIAVTSKIPDAL